MLISSRVTGFANNRAHLERVADEVVIGSIKLPHQALGPHLVKRAFIYRCFPLGSCCSLPADLILAILIPRVTRFGVLRSTSRWRKQETSRSSLRSMRKDALIS